MGRGQLEQMEDGGLESTDGSLHPDVSPHGVPGRRGVAPRDHLEPAPSGQPTRTCLFLSYGFQERKRLCRITVPGSCLPGQSLGGHQKQRESPRETPHGPLTTGEDGLDSDLRRKALPLLPEAETVDCTEGGKEPGTGRGAGGPAHLQPTSAFRGPAGPWLCAARLGRCPSRTHSTNLHPSVRSVVHPSPGLGPVHCGDPRGPECGFTAQTGATPLPRERSGLISFPYHLPLCQGRTGCGRPVCPVHGRHQGLRTKLCSTSQEEQGDSLNSLGQRGPGLAGGDPHPLHPRTIHGSQPDRAGQSRQGRTHTRQGSAGRKLGPQAAQEERWCAWARLREKALT